METKPNFYQALIKARLSIDKITKNAKGYNYTYADLPAVLDAVIQPLADNAIFFHSHIEREGQETLHVSLTYALTGESISTYVPLIGIFSARDAKDSKNVMQRLGETITYATRYGILSLLGICPEKDNDAQNASSVLNMQKNPSTYAPQGTSKAAIKREQQVREAQAECDELSDDLKDLEIIHEIEKYWNNKKSLLEHVIDETDRERIEKVQHGIETRFKNTSFEKLIIIRDWIRDLKIPTASTKDN